MKVARQESWVNQLTEDARCWEPKVLEKMSSHFETQKPLEPELIEKIVKR